MLTGYSFKIFLFWWWWRWWWRRRGRRTFVFDVYTLCNFFLVFIVIQIGWGILNFINFFMIWLVQVVILDNRFLFGRFLYNRGLVSDVLNLFFNFKILLFLSFYWKLIGFLKGLPTEINLRVPGERNQVQKRFESEANLFFVQVLKSAESQTI